MSARAELWVEEHYHSPSRRSASARKFVLYAIARAANPKGEAVNLTISQLARFTDQHLRSVQSHVRALEREGALHCTSQGKGSGSAPNLYRIVGVASIPESPLTNGLLAEHERLLARERQVKASVSQPD